MVWVGALQVSVLTPPQSRWSMQGLRMWPGSEQVQAPPLPTSSMSPTQVPTCQELPSQLHVPVVPVLRAVAMAWVVVGSVQETPVPSNVPEMLMVVHPVASSVVRHVVQDVQVPEGGTDPPVKDWLQVGAGHTTVSHEPDTHASPRAQAIPPEPAQPPQLRGSEVVSEHRVPSMTVSPSKSWGQLTSGAAHVAVQVPAVQTSPSPQRVSHAPQFVRSDSRSRQEPEQSVNPPGQEAMQVPAEQTSLVSHAEPQDPQLAGSRWRSRQAPEHRVSPA